MNDRINTITILAESRPYIAALLMFTIGFGYDFVWARWSASVAAHKAWYAANWSVGIFAAGIAYTLMIATGQFWQVATFVAGAYIGTVVAVKIGSKHG